jgi:fluoride exporter
MQSPHAEVERHMTDDRSPRRAHNLPVSPHGRGTPAAAGESAQVETSNFLPNMGSVKSTGLPQGSPISKGRSSVAVAFGAFFGAATREAVANVLPTGHGSFPRATLLINLTGAFLLGALVGQLGRSSNDDAFRSIVRSTVGVGFLGAFTTYSTFAIESDLLLHYRFGLLSLIYVTSTVLGGLAAAAIGMKVVDVSPRRRNGSDHANDGNWRVECG